MAALMTATWRSWMSINVGSGVGSADADVVEATADAQADGAGFGSMIRSMVAWGSRVGLEWGRRERGSKAVSPSRV